MTWGFLLKIALSKCYISNMNKKALIVVLLIILVASFGVLKLFILQSPSTSAIKVDSNPAANIFINDKLLGKTPLEKKYPSGEYTLKLIPLDSSIQTTSWQGKIILNPSLYTYIKKDLGQSENFIGGEILTLEKLARNDTQLNILSIPDAAIVMVDGLERGITPLFLEDLQPGEHDVSISAVGFVNRTVRVQLTEGYKLTANIQLALSSETVISPTQSPIVSTDGTKKPVSTTVVITDTETGFLRVRSGPGKSATESAQVKPGDKFPFIEEKDGWTKILLNDGKEGWVSSRYTEKQQ